jgi:hypothetical protein
MVFDQNMCKKVKFHQIQGRIWSKLVKKSNMKFEQTNLCHYIHNYDGCSYTKSGVSNTNLSEGHIPKKIKCSAGRSLLEKSFSGPQFKR